MFARLRRAGLAPCGESAPALAGFATLLVLALGAIPGVPTPAIGDMVEKRTEASADDAEQNAAGSMYLNSSDLELVFDKDLQTVGLRWTGLQIPPGATITAAYIQFASNEAQSESTNLTIQAHAADNAPVFASANNLSAAARPRTTAAATWLPAAWTVGAAGAAQRTPDLSAVIQQVVGRPGWAIGNALAIIITGTGHRTAYSWDGNAAQAPLLHVEFTSGGNPAAVLSVTQPPTPALTARADGSASSPGSGGVIASYRFDFGDGTAPVVTTAPTAIANHAYAAAGTYTITLTVTDVGGHVSPPVTASFIVRVNSAPVARLTLTLLGTPALTVRADGSTSTDTDFATIASYQFSWGDGTPATTTTAPTAIAQHTYAAAGSYTVTLIATDAGGLASAPATATIAVQADSPPVARVTAQQLASPPLTVVADGATSTDADVTPIASYRFTFGDGTAAVTTTAPTASTQHTYAAAGTYTVTLIATDTGGLASAPATTSVVVNPPTSGATTFEKRVAASADDAEQTSSGSVVLNSSDIEMVLDNTVNQTVGLRWTGLTIPPGSQIVAAYVQFRADEAQSEVTQLTIAGQAADNAAIFAGTASNVSSRPRTAATVSWSPNAWVASQEGVDQRTPDLSPVIQQIVGRAGWTSGNALALIITGTGHRTAVAWDASPTQAPLLHIEYQAGGVPTARLSLTPSATPPYTVNADGSASTAPPGKTIASCTFNFGDGTAPVTMTPPNATALHTYAAPGTYTVSLVVTDSDARTSSPATASITFAPEGPPTARLTVTQPFTPPLTARADGSTSTDLDTSPIASYRFDFGDGTTPVTTTAPTAIATHAYAAAGTYTVSLIATDTAGRNSTPATASIVIQANSAPVARLAVSQLVTPVLTVRADGSTSTDTDFAPIASYRFTWGDGTAATTTTAPTAIATHAYAAAGTYTVTLTATDAAGLESNAATANVTVMPDDPPVARLTLTQPATPALTVRADASTSTDTDLTAISSYRFTWGDGTAATTTTAPTAIATHAYAAAGTYTVSVTATDAAGQVSPAANASITVVPENPPVARLTATQAANPPLTVTADGGASTDADLTPIASLRFDWGDGSAATTTTWPTATAQHTYGGTGNYVVTLIATDNAGNASVPVTVTVPILGQVSMERRIAVSSDDAEQRANASVTLGSSSLQLVVDGSNQQTVGLRWTNIAIAKGTPIAAAWVQFTASASQSGTMGLTIAGFANDNTPTFTTANNNVSSRARTTATVAWAPNNAWTSGQAGANQRTTDIKAVIQEIVNRNGWTSGNALGLVITGTGSRTAQGFDGNAATAPLLHIEYQGIGTPPTARLTTQATGGLGATANGSTSTPGDSPIASYRFTWGDGTAATTVNAPTSSASHTYAAAGTYTVTLFVTDTAGRQSAPATANVTVTTGGGGGPIAVYVGYYDTHHADRLRAKPNPWYGSSGIQFVGTPDSGSGGWDSSGIRIDNLSSGSLTVTVTVDMGSSHFALWGSRTIAAGGTLVLAQTGFENFDGSDTSPAGCFDCNPNDCLTKVVNTVPVVHVTMNGTTTNFYDTGQISNTHGVDMAGCPYTGTRNDESQVWTQIFTQAPQASATAAREELEPAPVRSHRLWFGPVSPNPAGVDLVLRYEIPTRQNVSIGIYDVQGRLIKTHADTELEAGEYVSHINLSTVPPGMYYCTLRTGGQTLHQRFVHVQ